MTLEKRQRTEKSRYKHKSTGDYCTCAAFVAEAMCMKKAEHESVGSLPFKFWNKDPWKKFFMLQTIKANRLLKKYSEPGLIKAIGSKDFKYKKIFSLNHPAVEDIIKKYDAIAAEESNKMQKLDVKKNATRRKSSYGKKTALSRLRGLEDGGNESEEDRKETKE